MSERHDQGPKYTPAEVQSSRRYFVEFGGAMLGYVVLLPSAILLIRRLPEWRLGLALLPVAPLALGLMAVLRFLRRMDEFNRQLQLEAIGFAFGGGVMATMTYGLLEALAGLPRISWTWVPVVFLSLYGLGTGVARWRYR